MPSPAVISLFREDNPCGRDKKASSFPVHLHMDGEKQNQRVIHLYQQLPVSGCFALCKSSSAHLLALFIKGIILLETEMLTSGKGYYMKSTGKTKQNRTLHPLYCQRDFRNNINDLLTSRVLSLKLLLQLLLDNELLTGAAAFSMGHKENGPLPYAPI